MARFIFLVLFSSTVVFFFNALLPFSACAEGIDLNMEFLYINSQNETTNEETGEVTESTFSEFDQRYNLKISKTIYPYLTFQGGSIFELDRSESASEDLETEIKERTIRPFLELNLNNPVYKAGILYRKTEIKEEITDITTTHDSKEEFNTILGWRPVELPHFILFYNWTHTFDDIDTVDSTEKLLNFETTYSWKDLSLRYTYSRNEREDEISLFETLHQTHNGNINYSRSFLNRRLFMDTGYRIQYSTVGFSGAGSAAFAVLRSAGLSSLDEIPEDGPALSPVPALIDGNLTASSGINIGLDGDETTLTNIGLDFGFPTSVDKISIWVDRNLSSSVANSFSWSVYTSPDNTDTSTWTLHSAVFPAPFGTFQNRFEISFPDVETRFIKVVVRPLSQAVPDASNFPNIFVTEIEAFATVSGQDDTTTSLEHNYNLSLRGKLSDKTVLGYNLYYSLREKDPPSETETSLSNSVYLSHFFNRVFTFGTRLERDDIQKTAGDDFVAYNYSASLKAAYLETFSQTLTYSFTQVEEESDSSTTNSILLRNNAELYRGWSAYLDAGYSWDKPAAEDGSTSILVRTGSNIVPNEKISINTNYSATKTIQSGEDDESSLLRQTGDLQVFLIPFRTLSLFARLSFVDDGDSTRLLQNYSANWSPFPDGTLQFFFTFNETLRSEEEQKDRSIGPGLKWNITRRAKLELAYLLIKNESELETIDSKNFNVRLNMYF